MVASKFGQGRSLAVGTFLGMPYEIRRNAKSAQFFDGLLQWAGVSRRVRVSGESDRQMVEVRQMTSGREMLLFVFNHSLSSSSPVIRLRQAGPKCQATDLRTGQPVKFSADGEELTFTKNMAPHEVWVLRITPKA